MINTIRETATSLLQQRGMGSYITQAEPVIEGLEARDAVITERLTDYAVGMGVSEDEVDRLMVEVGLRAPSPVLSIANGASGGSADSGDDERAPAWAQQIIDRIDSLTTFARRNGYSG